MTKETFYLKQDHLRLLEQINICWSDEEYGVLKVNNDQPIGNSVSEPIENKLCDCLNINDRDGKDVEYANKIYNELDTAMQIVLSNKTFKTGVFEREKSSDNWSRIAVEHDGSCPACDKRVSLSIASMYGKWKCSECNVTQAINLER